MHFTEMTDEALALMSADLDSERVRAPHNFTGIDGRCMDCDCRPYGVHALNPCPVVW